MSETIAGTILIEELKEMTEMCMEGDISLESFIYSQGEVLLSLVGNETDLSKIKKKAKESIKGRSKTVETPINTGTSMPRDSATPNSI